MSNANDIIEELENTPDDLLTPVKSDYKPPTLSDDIKSSLTLGKEEIIEGETDNIVLPDAEGEVTEIKTKTEKKIPAGEEDTEIEEDAAEEAETGEETEFNLSELIPPSMAIDILELVLVFVGIYFVSKWVGTELEKDLLEFTPEEKATLKKPLARCFKETKTVTKNPWIALAIALVAILLVKGFTIYMIVKEREETRKKEEAEVENNKNNNRQNVLNELYEEMKEKPKPQSKTTGKRGRKPGGKNKPKLS